MQEFMKLFPMPEITARRFVADMASQLKQCRSQLSHAIQGSPDAVSEYVQLMINMRIDLARGVCAWISLREGVGKKAIEYREVEMLAVQTDRFTKFGLEAIRILGCYLDGGEYYSSGMIF